MLREVDELLCTIVLYLLIVCASCTCLSLFDLVQEVHRQFWPRDRYLSECAFLLNPMRFAFELKAVCSCQLITNWVTQATINLVVVRGQDSSMFCPAVTGVGTGHEMAVAILRFS